MATRSEAWLAMQRASKRLSAAINSDGYFDTGENRVAYDRRVEAAAVAHLEASREYDRAVANEGPNAAITEAFRRLKVDTTGFRTDDYCTTRIGSSTGAWPRPDVMVHVSDHMQGRGFNVPLREAKLLDVRLFTRRSTLELVNIEPADLYDTLLMALDDIP